MGGYRLWAVLGAGFLAGGCATQELYVVVPDQEGKAGTVVVKHGDSEAVLNRPYAAARIQWDGRLDTKTASEQEVKEVFGKALAAQPARVVSFVLYFVEGSDEFTAESNAVVDRLFGEIARRPVPEVVVIGHTDRVGTIEYNDNLSLQRAEKVKSELVRRGIPADGIRVAGRGEREPLVSTDDDVAEPRNRRVEISVR